MHSPRSIKGVDGSPAGMPTSKGAMADEGLQRGGALGGLRSSDGSAALLEQYPQLLIVPLQ
jgi:hypothetical protein